MVFRLPDGGPVRVRTSNTASETPTSAELEEGEVALNAADGVLYFQGTSGSVGPVGFQDAPEDEIIYGRKDGEWVDITAPANLQVRRGTASEVAAITPLEGEPVWATDTKRLVVGDGATTGGILAGNRSFFAASDGEVGRSESETRTVDPNIAVALGPAGTYYVNIYATFQAEDEEAYGAASLNIALPSTNLAYIVGASAAPETQSVTAEVYEYKLMFVCTSSLAGVTLGIFWRAANSSPILRGQSYLVATLVT